MFYNVQPYSSAGTVASAVIKTTQSRLHWISPYNNNAATRYLMVFDATAVPVNGTAPLFMFPIAANSAPQKELAFPPDGLLCRNGLVVAISTTAVTLTIGAATDLIFTAGYS